MQPALPAEQGRKNVMDGVLVVAPSLPESPQDSSGIKRGSGPLLTLLSLQKLEFLGRPDGQLLR